MQATFSAHSSRSITVSPAIFAAASAAATVQERTPSLDSDALLNGQKSVTITHNGTLYRLQATKLGKLILTK